MAAATLATASSPATFVQPDFGVKFDVKFGLKRVAHLDVFMDVSSGYSLGRSLDLGLFVIG
jgi:hypothetical protein